MLVLNFELLECNINIYDDVNLELKHTPDRCISGQTSRCSLKKLTELVAKLQELPLIKFRHINTSATYFLFTCRNLIRINPKIIIVYENHEHFDGVKLLFFI